MLPNPQPFFAHLPDPRRATRNKLHKLSDILMITLCAVLCGIEDWVGIEDFGHEHEAWLRRYLELPHGIPSHDTLSDVIGRIERKAFTEAFAEWVRASLPSLADQQVAIDGKTLRGSRRAEETPVHLLSAFAAQARLVLAVAEVGDKSNEIKAIPALLQQLKLTGAVVSIDAMGCQKSVAEVIVGQHADYVLALKENHSTLYEDVSLWLGHVTQSEAEPMQETVEKGHGRLETRRVWVSTQLDWLQAKVQWAGLKSVSMVESLRNIAGKQRCERRYYVSSLSNPEQIAQTIRQHWSIENQQHWILDVQFGEDAHRASKSHSAANLGIIRRTALNLLRQDQSNKLSLRRRKMRALANAAYRQRILFGDEGT